MNKHDYKRTLSSDDTFVKIVTTYYGVMIFGIALIFYYIVFSQLV